MDCPDNVVEVGHREDGGCWQVPLVIREVKLSKYRLKLLLAIAFEPIPDSAHITRIDEEVRIKRQFGLVSLYT